MIEQSALARIKPSPKEQEKLDAFVGKLVHVAHKISGLECIPCGSIGKGTWLSGDHDVDLFILFPKETPRQELERRGLDFGERIAQELHGKKKLKYAEHPYTQISVAGYIVDIVPCYKISKGEPIISAVDRSPLHLEFVREHMKNGDEARLLKQFCKGIGVYGSDAMHLGFSGYVCEILVIKYGSFINVIKEAENWSAPFTVSLNAPSGKFLRTPLIVIDPVDSSRNAAANINEENFVKFVSACSAYLKKQSLDFFFPKKPQQMSRKELKKLGERETFFIAISIKKPDLLEDILYPQLRRALHRINNMLSEQGFSVIRSYDFVSDKIVLLFELEVWSLPQIEKMIGPPIYSKKHSAEFLGKYEKNAVYIENSVWIAEKKRKYTKALEFLKDFVKLEPAKLESSGIPSNIAKAMQNCKISNNLNLLLNDKKLSIVLRERYFSKIV